MFRIASIVLVAMLTLQSFGQEQVQSERRKFQGSSGQKSGLREQRRLDKNQNVMMGQALRHPKVAEKLGLSEEQREAIDQELKALQKRQIELRAEMEEAALEQARLMSATELDEAALMAAVEETGRIHTKMAKLRIKHLLFMRKTLTPEQIQQARTIIRERMKSRREDGSKQHGKRQREGEERQWRSKKSSQGEEAL